MNPASHELLPLLKQYFGYTSFRPLQEEIIRDSLAGRDTFALLPTGGGKSLCFQLPALVRPGLTVVISPLIALMKDQVDAMKVSGVPATFLNSSLAAGESRPRLRGLHNGEYKLLYVAPERLLLPDFLDDLKRWNVSMFAIDEAHCISEWGHDFRPEYRQISTLREVFPGVPFMALTATATERVRADIVKQLHLRESQIYVASFNRPNLTYRVRAKSGADEQVLDFIRARPKESGIVYCHSRKMSESVALKLNEGGVPARAYHAGLSSEERHRIVVDHFRFAPFATAKALAVGMVVVQLLLDFRCLAHVRCGVQHLQDGAPAALYAFVARVHTHAFRHACHTGRCQHACAFHFHYAQAAQCVRSAVLVVADGGNRGARHGCRI